MPMPGMRLPRPCPARHQHTTTTQAAGVSPEIWMSSCNMDRKDGVHQQGPASLACCKLPSDRPPFDCRCKLLLLQSSTRTCRAAAVAVTRPCLVPAQRCLGCLRPNRLSDRQAMCCADRSSHAVSNTQPCNWHTMGSACTWSTRPAQSPHLLL